MNYLRKSAPEIYQIQCGENFSLASQGGNKASNVEAPPPPIGKGAKVATLHKYTFETLADNITAGTAPEMDMRYSLSLPSASSLQLSSIGPAGYFSQSMYTIPYRFTPRPPRTPTRSRGSSFSSEEEPRVQPGKRSGLSKLRNKARVIRLKLRETARSATSIFRPRKDDSNSLSIGPKAAKQTDSQDSQATEYEPEDPQDIQSMISSRLSIDSQFDV